jgi:hypothetical protein
MDKKIIGKDLRKVFFLSLIFVVVLLVLDYLNLKMHVLDNLTQNWVK